MTPACDPKQHFFMEEQGARARARRGKGKGQGARGKGQGQGARGKGKGQGARAGAQTGKSMEEQFCIVKINVFRKSCIIF